MDDKYQLQLIEEEHLEEVLEFLLTDFVHDEPLDKAVQLTAEEARSGYRQLIGRCMRNAVSYMFRDSGTGKIVACALNELGTIGEQTAADFSGHSKKFQTVFTLVENLKSDMHTLLVPDSKYLEIVLLSVGSTSRGLGLAKRLTERSITMAMHWQCRYVISVATNGRSQSLFRKFGLTVRRAIAFEDYFKHGQQVFVVDDNITTDAQLMRVFSFVDESVISLDADDAF
ncbi:Dopamine N-acetyltransferase [Trichinella sp. T9]|uniref:aralkylamine N-acetyltransferase n=1 Tax=Trichinella murrelli TaxID=144512 RepID=A0A0V0TJB2_9BILA|nr:Dopamine N-acetyltransferase [Trichinella murrelli]KRX53564.1 Dopamine N-acetyltransferase [Trichinella sp. T9]